MLDVSENEEFSRALCAQLVSLATFRRVQKIDASELIDLLFSGMEKAEFSSEMMEWFENARQSFEGLLKCEAVKLPSKALHLSTDFQQLFAAANIVTDVRPVFDEDRKSVAGAIVVQTLRIRFVESGGTDVQKEMSLALDSDDIDKLIAELEKAKQKAECAKERFSENTDDDVFVVGEETYGFS